MELWKIIGIAILILVITILIMGVILDVYTSYKCKSECKNKGTEFYEKYPNGKFDIKDLCVCYYPNNKIESFILK